MKRVIAICWVIGALLAAPAAWAANVAVLFANGAYQSYPLLQNRRAVLDLAQPLQRAGFEVIVVRNLDSQTLAEDMPAISSRLARADKIIMVTSGYIVRTSRDAWLMAADADKPDAFNIGRYGLSLGGLMDIASRKQGDALIAITENQPEITLGSGLNDGYVPRDIPQGVTLVRGAPNQIADFIVGTVLVPGRSLAEAAKAMPDPFRAHGYVPRTASFLPVSFQPAPAPMPTPAANLIERSFWQRTRSLNTVDAYQLYLSRYPNGIFAAQANDRIAALGLTPQDRARLAEEALALTGSQRRGVQNNLTILGFDTRGVDGVFGRRSRAAIAEWQTSLGIPATGYLTANQVSQLQAAGARRAEELRQEAERRQRQRERQDRNFWAATGADGSEAGLRAYIKRFPDGLYSDIATQQLDAIEREKRRLANAEERDFWNQTRMVGTLEAYNEYLRLYPGGRFVDEARARVASLSEPETPPEIIKAAKQEEASLNLNGLRRQLIENQLQALGLEPGPVDGKFDVHTRRALRKFQRANNLYVTGFVTRDTIVRLLVSSIDN